MATKHFNLSVLENVTPLNTPLKQSSDYEAIFSLIKEEIDILQTEDEMEYRKVEKITKNKRPESCSSETLFKSPMKKKKCLKLKNSYESTGVRKERLLESRENKARERRAESVGRAKPGRSVVTDHRKRKNSASHSDASAFSEYGDDSAAETPRKIFKTTIRTRNEDRGVERTHGIDFANGDADLPIARIKSERTNSVDADSPDVEANDESFVESSQSLAESSELLDKLNRRRSITGTSGDEGLKNEVKNHGEEEEDEEDQENQQFSLALSPDSKSCGSTGKKETNRSPSWSRKNKAVCRVSPLKGLTRENKASTDKSFVDAASLGRRVLKNSSASPLKGFSLELDNSIREDDYVEMCDSDAETTSFTFETIQLLNDYDESNRKANNQMLDKIFSSPMGPLEEIPEVNGNAVSSEDPLRIDDNDANEQVPPLKSKIDVATKKNTGVSKRKKCNNAISADVDVPPAKTKRRSKAAETSTECNEKSMELPTTNTEKRRSSDRLKNKPLIDTESTDDERENELSAKAAKLVEKVSKAKRKTALPEETLDKLEKLIVRLRHKVLPQHEIEHSAGSTALSHTQQKQFLRHAPLNKKTYTPAEDETIKQNWNLFCQDHDWNPDYYKPFLLLKHGDDLIMSSLEERRKFVQFLANGLPNRPLCSVYNRFRRLYNKYEATGWRYTKKEDETIIAYMKYNPDEPREQKFSELARVMKRSRTSIWKRYTKLVEKNSSTKKKTKQVMTKVEWNLPLAEKFITTLMDVTLSDELIDLKDAFLPRVIWLKLEEKMKIRYDVTQRFWERQLHLQLFAPETISINEIKIKLIECMHVKKISHTKEIKWDEIVKYFDGYTIPFLRHVFNHLTRMAAVTLKTRNFCEILQWLHAKKIESLLSAPEDRCLPRISYVNKKAEFVAKDLAGLKLVSESSDVD